MKDTKDTNEASNIGSVEPDMEDEYEITEEAVVEHGLEGHEERLEQEIAQLTDQLKRVQAEFQNYIKRQEREAEESQKLAKKDLIKELLRVLDNLERALHSKNNGEELHKGIEMVYQDLLKIFNQEGVHPIEALGKPFDPNQHDVLLTAVDNSKEEGTILEEYERGYTIHGKVLRYSKVKISKKDPNKEE